MESLQVRFKILGFFLMCVGPRREDSNCDTSNSGESPPDNVFGIMLRVGHVNIT